MGIIVRAQQRSSSTVSVIVGTSPSHLVKSISVNSTDSFMSADKQLITMGKMLNRLASLIKDDVHLFLQFLIRLAQFQTVAVAASSHKLNRNDRID